MLVSTLASPAFGQTGKIDVTGPAPAPPVQRSYHVHDGFYARVNLGVGSLGLDFHDDSPSNVDLEGSGLSLSFDLLVGGSPTRGVAIGGALLGSAAFSVGFEREGASVGDRSVAFGIIGPFIDGFPDPQGGWHLGGAVGFATIDIENDARSEGLTNTRGFGGAAWVGHDWWVGAEWSTGVLLRVQGASTRQGANDLDVSASALGISLMFTALYH